MYKEKVMKITSYIVGSQTLSFSINVRNVRLAFMFTRTPIFFKFNWV